MIRLLAIMGIVAPALAGGAELERHADGTVFSPQRAFRIPLDLRDGQSRSIESIRLYVSRDAGKTWTMHAEAPPSTDVMTYRAESDGPCWLAIAMVDRDGNQLPKRIEEVEPGLKVVIDTTKPTLALKPVRNKAGRRGLRWELTDDHIDPASFRLAIWSDEASGWKPHAIDAAQKSLVWFEDQPPVRKIQGMVKDLAGNVAVMEVELDGERFSKRTPKAFALEDSPPTKPVVTEDHHARRQSIPTATPRNAMVDTEVKRTSFEQPTEHRVNSAPRPPQGRMDVSRSRRVSVNYEVDDDSRNGQVELWGTRDRGETWTRLAADQDGQSPVDATVPSSGVWGLAIVVGHGGEDTSPKPGTDPEFYVEVDDEPPVVELSPPQVEKGQVMLRWSAEDKNLDKATVELFHSSQPRGPWKKIASGLEASGEFAWPFAKDGVNGTGYFQLKARDRAGNVATVESDRVALRTTSRGRVLGLADPGANRD